MNRHHNLMILCYLLAFVVLSISSCGKSTVTTASTSMQTSTATGTGNAQNVADTKKGQATPTGQRGSILPATINNSESILANNDTVYVGSSKGILVALDANHGTVNWQKSLGSPVYVASIAEGMVIASSDHTVYAFDTSSGKQLWSKQVARIAGAGVNSSHGIIYITSAILNDSYYTITALSIIDGSQLWQYKASAFTPDFLGVANGIAYAIEMHGNGIGNLDQSLIALRATDGKLLWHVSLNNTGGLARAQVVSTNGITYLTTTIGSVIALHTDTGALAWQHINQETRSMPSMNVIQAFPVAIANGIVYATDTQATSAFRATDGSILWKKPYSATPPTPLPFIVQPVVNNSVVYIGTHDESVQALRASDGAQLWQNKDIQAREPLVVQAGLLYINASNTLYTLDIQDGKVVWQQSIQHPDGSGPMTHEAITKQGVSIGQSNGTVQTFDAINGKLRWSRTV